MPFDASFAAAPFATPAAKTSGELATAALASLMASVLRDVEAHLGADDEHVRGMREGLATVLDASSSSSAQA